jgi:phage terminase small subunit
MNAKGVRFTKKQTFFIAEYQKDWNATQAAIRAGYSPKTAKEMAYKLVHKSLLQEVLAREVEERLLKIGVRAERVLQEIARIGFSDLGKLFRADGTMWPVQDMDDDTRAALAAVQTFEEFDGKGDDRHFIGYTKKIKLFDKVKALELLGRHLKLFPTGDQKVDVGLTVKDSRETMSPLQIAAKIMYVIEIAKRRQKELEEAKKLEGG